MQGSIYLGGKFLSQTLQLPPQKFCQLNLTKSYNVLAKNLSEIPQLLGPQNCLRMPQNHSQKAQNLKKNWGGIPPDPPIHCKKQRVTLTQLGLSQLQVH